MSAKGFNVNVTKVKQIIVGDDIVHSRLNVCECRISHGVTSGKVYFIGHNGPESLKSDIIKFLAGESDVCIFKQMSDLKADSVIEFTDQIYFGKSAASNCIIFEMNFFFLRLND